jgi:cell division septation protein DedD
MEEFDNSEVLVDPAEKKSGGFCIILGSFQQENNAQKAKSTFAEKGIDTRILAHQQGKRLAHGAFADRATAQAAMAKLNLQGWILKLE